MDKPPETTAVAAAMAALQQSKADNSDLSAALKGNGHDAPWFNATVAFNKPLGIPAFYDAITASFKHVVTIKSDRSFRLVPRYVGGYIVIVMVPGKSLKFLDLPIEMRQMIYGYLLTLDEPVKFKRYEGRIVQQSFVTGEESSPLWDHGLKKWKFSSTRHFTSIVGVNKQIHREATEVLYGTNRFLFPEPKTIPRLLKVAEGSFKFLRAISIVAARDDEKNGLVRAMWHLQSSPHLRYIGLSHASYCKSPIKKNPSHPRVPNKITPSELARATEPLLRCLDTVRRQQQIEGDVTDIFSTTPCSCFHCKQMTEAPAKRSVHCHCENLAMVTKVDNDFWTQFKREARRVREVEDLNQAARERAAKAADMDMGLVKNMIRARGQPLPARK